MSLDENLENQVGMKDNREDKYASVNNNNYVLNGYNRNNHNPWQFM